jgi:eukaryotic-like serine/threonine-protein kinase
MSLQQIIHVNIVRTLDVFESKTSVYTIMEDGGSSLAKLALERPFSQAELVQLVRQVALAHLEFERLGLVHSDIKPQNILLREGVFRLCDFSLARPEGQYKFAGTLEYSAP